MGLLHVLYMSHYIRNMPLNGYFIFNTHRNEFKNAFDPNRFSNKNASKVSIYDLIATSW